MTHATLLLIIGGLVGAVVGVIHGVLLASRVVPSVAFERSRSTDLSLSRLVAGLLHFSTFAWITGGCLLAAAAWLMPPPARLIAGILVGSQFLYGAVGNYAALRRPHPGWILMGVAVVLIACGLVLDFA